MCVCVCERERERRFSTQLSHLYRRVHRSIWTTEREARAEDGAERRVDNGEKLEAHDESRHYQVERLRHRVRVRVEGNLQVSHAGVSDSASDTARPERHWSAERCGRVVEELQEEREGAGSERLVCSAARGPALECPGGKGVCSHLSESIPGEASEKRC